VHRAKIEKFSHAWVAVCEDCDWMGSDHPLDKSEARKDAQMHERGERRPWEAAELEPWTPSRHPIPQGYERQDGNTDSEG